MNPEYPPQQPQQPYQGQPQTPPPGYAPPPPGYAPPPPQQSYGYAQPGYPPQQPPFGASATPNRWGPTSLGLDANIAAGLSYIPIVGLIFFFIEKTNRFVRFNSAQSIMLLIASVVLSFLDTFINIVDNSGFLALGIGCLISLVGLGLFALLVWGFISGFTGKFVKFPLIGNIAEQWAGGPPVPLF